MTRGVKVEDQEGLIEGKNGGKDKGGERMKKVINEKQPRV